MRCDDMREQWDTLWEGEPSEEVRRHLAQCAACARVFRDLRLVRAGFRLFQREPGPEPSLGFAERLVRQLGEIGKQPSVVDFFEQVGRRFVYATLALAFLALLALAVPSTGPLRGQMAEPLTPVQDAALSYSEPEGDFGLPEATELTPVDATVPSGPTEVQ